MSSLSWGSFAKETYDFKEPTTCRHPISLYVYMHMYIYDNTYVICQHQVDSAARGCCVHTNHISINICIHAYIYIWYTYITCQHQVDSAICGRRQRALVLYISYVCIRVYVRIYIYVYMYIYWHIYRYTWPPIVGARIPHLVRVYTCICAYIYMNIYTYIDIYIATRGCR